NVFLTTEKSSGSRLFVRQNAVTTKTMSKRHRNGRARFFRSWTSVALIAGGMVCSWFASGENSSTNRSVAPWTNAVWSDPKFFPIAVWLQNPSNAARYRALGINTYVGLWQGPTEEQLRALKDAGMYVVCDQNE